MNNVLKDTFREIKKSFPRFLSILLIVGLGVYVLVGLISTGPIMRQSAQRRIETQNFPDILVTVPMGLEDKDYDILENQEDIEEMEYGYDIDIGVKNSTLLIKVMNLPFEINRPIVTEGELPKKQGEIFLDDALKEEGYHIGDRISFKKEVDKFDAPEDNDETNDALAHYDYKIVGFGRSLSYVSFQTRGYSQRGLGEIKGFAYVMPEEFQTDPTMANIVYKGTKAMDTASKEYRNFIEQKYQALKIDMKHRPDRRLIELKEEIGDEIEEGEDKIADAKDQLSDAENKLADAREQLDEGRKTYREGKEEFEREKSKGQKKLSDSREKLYRSEKDIDKAQNKLLEGHEELQKGKRDLKQAKVDLDKGRREYMEGKSEYERGQGELKAGETALSEGEDQLRDGRQKLDEGWKTIEDSKRKLQESKDEYIKGVEELEAGRRKMEAGLAEISSQLGIPGANVNQVEEKLGALAAGLEQADELIGGMDQIQAGKKQALAKKQELENTKAALKAKKIEVEKLKGELSLQQEALKTEKANLEEKLALLQGSLPHASDQEKPVIEAQIIEIQNGIKQINAGIDQLAKGIDEANQGLQEIDENQKKVDSGLVQIDETVKDLQSKEELLKQNIDKANAQLPGNMDIVKDRVKLQGLLEKARQGVQEINKAQTQLIEGDAKLQSAREMLEQGEQQLAEGIEEAQSGEVEYTKNKHKLEEKRRELEEGRQKLLDAQRELADAREKISDGERKYEDGKRDYDDHYQEYLEKRSELDAGKMAFRQGREDLVEGEKTYQEEIQKGEEKLRDARSKLYKGERDLAEGQQEYDEKSQEAKEKIADGEEKIADGYRFLDLIKEPRYSIIPRYEFDALHTYLDEAKRVDYLAFIFPVFFFIISMLVCFTTMTRMVDEQRIIIGTYKALGYSKKEISKKFFYYGGLASILGGVIGALSGAVTITYIIAVAYSTETIFVDDLWLTLFPGKILFAIVFGFIFTALAAKMTVNNILNENVANLLRKKPPKTGHRIFLERISFIWNRMSFLQKVTARNIFRYKRRMIMTIIGILGCTAFLILGFGIRGSVKDLDTIQFRDLLKYSISVNYDREIDRDSYDAYRQYVKDQNIQYKEFYLDNLTVEIKDGNQNLMLYVPMEEDEFDQYIHLKDAKTYKNMKLPQRGAIVTHKLAKLKKLKPGDLLKIKDVYGKEFEVEIAGICETYLGHSLYMSPEYFEKIFDEKPVANGDLMKLDTMSSEEIETLSAQFTDYRSVTSVINLGLQRDILNQYLYSISKVEGVILIVSTLLAMVVLFNLTNINIAERSREISTIKVLGFYPKETTKYIYRETGILTLMGIFIGLFAGKILHYVILQIVVPLEAMLLPHLAFNAYVRSALITAAVSICVMLYFHFKINRIDMVESLKGNE